jgi:hypothetical protein
MINCANASTFDREPRAVTPAAVAQCETAQLTDAELAVVTGGGGAAGINPSRQDLRLSRETV